MTILKKTTGIFDADNKLYRLDILGDPLVLLNKMMDWESFRGTIESCFKETDPKKGGRPSFDRVMMFKILILQRHYNLSDDRAEYQINDRLSFMRFLNLGMGDKVPDSKTIWLFRETLDKSGVLDQIFDKFTDKLKQLGLIINDGQIVDATILETPIQRNSRDENKEIKTGGKPEYWNEAKSRQKDTDADWIQKNNKSQHGYKNHIKMDKISKLITNFQTTPASVADRDVLDDLLEESDRGQELLADRGYPGKKNDNELEKRGIINRIMRKGAKSVKLSKEEIENNHEISKERCRVEHGFGYMKRQKEKYLIRCVGLQRATAQITMLNLDYNFMRSIKLVLNLNLGVKLGI